MGCFYRFDYLYHLRPYRQNLGRFCANLRHSRFELRFVSFEIANIRVQFVIWCYQNLVVETLYPHNRF